MLKCRLVREPGKENESGRSIGSVREVERASDVAIYWSRELHFNDIEEDRTIRFFLRKKLKVELKQAIKTKLLCI